MSALVALLGAVMAVAGNSTVANAETSAPDSEAGFYTSLFNDSYCC